MLQCQSPGPGLNNATDPENPTWGPSLGSLIQQYGFNAADLRDSARPF